MNRLTNDVEKRRGLAWGIAYCLAYDRGFEDAALSDLKNLVRSEVMPSGTPNDEASIIAEAAWRIASTDNDEPEHPRSKEEIRNGRLLQLNDWLNCPGIALVMGGATKIKQYVFESAKLPEIRGASSLLDRINLQDICALFTEQSDEKTTPESEPLWQGVRQSFKNDYGIPPPNCEGCIIYANGGEILAFAPTKISSFIVDAIERRYTKETLVANSVAVQRRCSLLELRYGLRPLDFWLDDLTSNESHGELLREYYGDLGKEESFFARKGFGEVAAWLALEKRRRREGNIVDERGRKPVPRFETTIYARRCHSCDIRNAVVERPLEDELAGEWLCEPCARKRVFGQMSKQESDKQTEWFRKAEFSWTPLGTKVWANDFAEWLDKLEDEDPKYRDLKRAYYGNADPSSIAPASDLDNIAKASKPEGYIGVIYADGNNMGSLLERLDTPAKYKEFAEEVYETIKDATFKAIANCLHPCNGQHPFEILSIGGDDVFLIVPASAALSIAIEIAESVEADLSKRRNTQIIKPYQWQSTHRIAKPDNWQPPEIQSRVSLSSGVVIAPHHTPIYSLHKLVDELLKSAKSKARRLRQQPGFYGATIDYVVLKSIGMIANNVEAFRENALHGDGTNWTAKPYTWQELRALIDTAKKLKKQNFPKTQLYRLRKQIEKGWLASSVDYLNFRLRLQKTQPEKLRGALDDMWVGTEQHSSVGGIGLWMRRDEKEWETIIGDLTEIYDFVREETISDDE
jgi:CRISPR-associated protein Cmr2